MGGIRRTGGTARTGPHRAAVLALLAASLLIGMVGSAADQATRAGAATVPAPPVIGSPAVNPTVVSAGSLVAFSWKVFSQDGVESTSLFVDGLDIDPIANCFGPASLVAGTDKAGTYEQLCTVPLVVADTTLNTVISAVDNDGQQVSAAGPSFTTTGGETPPPPPQIVITSVRPTTVRAGGKINFTWKVTTPDDVSDTSFEVSGPDGSQLANCFGPGTLVSGTAAKGTYRQVCVVPRFVDDGIWATSVYASDLDGSGVAEAGPSFTVYGGLPYVPPTITAATVTPSVVAAGGQVVFTWQASSPAGVEYTSLEASGPGSDFDSFSQCEGNGVLIAGTPQAGTYQQACTIPIGSPAGPWSTFIQVEDTTGGSTLITGPSFTVEPIVITTSSLPTGTIHQQYGADLSAVGGNPPYRWSLTAGSLPPGLRLKATGTITGRPTEAGQYSFTVGLVDKATGKPPTHNSASASLSITVSPV